MEKNDFKLTFWNWVVIFFKGKFGGGLVSVFEYVLGMFNDKVLSKISPENMTKYSGLVKALAEFGEKVLNLYVMDVAKRKALTKTVETLQMLAEALSDGKVTPDELEKAIVDVVDTVNAWRDLKSIRPAMAITDDSSAAAEILEQFVPGEVASQI